MPYLIEQMALSIEEKKKLQHFFAEHKIYCPDVKSHYSLSFSGEGGIGIGVYVKCNLCNRKKDITDYGRW